MDHDSAYATQKNKVSVRRSLPTVESRVVE
jgi:hypothetical protein